MPEPLPESADDVRFWAIDVGIIGVEKGKMVVLVAARGPLWSSLLGKTV